MKVSVEILRTVKVPVSDVYVILGLPFDEVLPAKDLKFKLSEAFGPLANNFKFLWESNEPNPNHSTLVGMGLFKFDMDVDHPIAPSSRLFHNMDDLNPEVINRIDGALFSELTRLGIYTEPKSYSFKSILTVTGDEGN